jgi:guanylate kinase
MRSGVYIISAPSGSGKTTLVERLLREVPRLHFSISYTTRQPRGQEQNGRDYFFVTHDEFQGMIARGELLEWAEVFGNYYGTARRFLDEAERHGNDLVLDIDIQGAAQVKEKIPQAVAIFILPPSRAVLEFRLRHRSQDSEEVIRKRLHDAGREIFGYVRYDYVLINDQLDQSAAGLRAIVLWERWRRGSAMPQSLPSSAESVNPEEVRRLADACRTERVQAEIQPILESFGG